MIYTRQQGACDARDYSAAISAYVAGTAGEEHSDALELWMVCHPYALEQRAEWPDESDVCRRPPVTLEPAGLKRAG
jgi:hypothetical protein